jgi:hypothetical protein
MVKFPVCRSRGTGTQVDGMNELGFLSRTPRMHRILYFSRFGAASMIPPMSLPRKKNEVRQALYSITPPLLLICNLTVQVYSILKNLNLFGAHTNLFRYLLCYTAGVAECMAPLGTRSEVVRSCGDVHRSAFTRPYQAWITFVLATQEIASCILN